MKKHYLVYIGLYYSNYGTVRNIQINLTQSTNVANTGIALLGYINWPTGIVENFVLNMQEPIYGANELYGLVRYNRGLIQNGYVYGENIQAIHPLAPGQTRNAAIITYYNYVNGSSKNIYSLASVDVLHQQGVTNQAANIVTTIASGSKMLNTYSVGIGNIEEFTKGPNTMATSTTRVQNCYYFADKVFKNSASRKTSPLALWDINFQNQAINVDGTFNVAELVGQGYYPHVNMPAVMPRQEYIELPEVTDEDLADLLSMEIKEQNDEEATVIFYIHNPSGESIKEIKVENLTSSIISQVYDEGVSKVEVKLTEPKKYVSKYNVQSITLQGPFGSSYTREYEKNEKFLNIEFFRKVNDVNSWKAINKSPTENYKLTQDIDFRNYNEYSISTKFSGKLDGNGNTLKNINISTNLIKELSGSIINLNISNITIDGKLSDIAIIGNSTYYSNIEDVHIENATINASTEGDVNVAVLAAKTAEANIQNCSIRNSIINVGTKLKAGKVKVGGIVGSLGTSKIYNSYTKNLEINVYNVNSSDGVGGIAGYITDNSIVQACYSHGKIDSSMPNTGGIVGNSYNGLVNNCYSAMQVESDIGYVGGIIGNEVLYSDREKSYGNIAIGGIYCKVASENVNRIMGSFLDGENYAYEGQKINGLESVEAMDAILLTKEELQDKETYISIIGWEEDYDYTNVTNGVLPKLCYKGTTNILPYQEDIYIEETNELTVEEVEIERSLDEDGREILKGRLVVKNTNQLEVTKINIEDMICETTKIDTQNGKTYINFTAKPEKFYDSYKIYEIEYKENGETKKQKIEAKIEAIFYKEIKNFEDWQNIEIGTYQNYRLSANIDFTGKQNIKTGLTIGRLDGNDYTIGILGEDVEPLTISINKANTGFIEDIRTEMKDITFKNIRINYTGTTSGKNFGLISKTTATLNNVTFNNIAINGVSTLDKNVKLDYVGIIGVVNYADISVIEMNNINVTGKNRVGGFFGETTETNMSDISAQGINVTGNDYIGSIGGYKSFKLGTEKTSNGITAKKVEVIGNSYVGGIFGYGVGKNITLEDSTITGNGTYVGGIGGNLGSYEPGQSIAVKNSIIEGSGNNIGGVSGYLNYGTLKDITVVNSIIKGQNSNYVGGITGASRGHQNNIAVIDSEIFTNGSYVGGITGNNESSYNSYYNFVQNTTITGFSEVGGIAGRNKAGSIYYCYVDADVKAIQHSAGGLVGYLDNIGMTSTNNTSKIYNSYVANSNISAKANVGGLIGDSYERLLEGSFYYNNLIEANITTDDISTASLGIGGKNKNSKLTNTYAYIGSTINKNQINNNNDTFTEEYLVKLEDLQRQSFYTSQLKWSTTYYKFNAAENKYPKIASGYNSQTQTGIDLPGFSQENINDIQEELPQVTAYSLRANRLNIDLSGVTSGTTLTYETENTEPNTIEVTDRTYTFAYDYQTPITLTLQNNLKEETIVIKPEDVRNSASVNENIIAYLQDQTLIVNGQAVQGNYKNLVEGEALLETGEIYNIKGNTIQDGETIALELVEKEAKGNYDYKGNKIETYGTYSIVNGKEVEAIFTENNQTLSVTDGKLENIQADKIVDNYNGKEYETILGNDGKMYDLKEPIKYPDNFKNEEIKTIALDSNSEARNVLVYYKNGSVVAFNYMTGEKTYETLKQEDTGLWENIKDKLKGKDESSIQESYDTSKNIEEKLKQKPLDAETGKNATYITMYNSETKTHEIYKEEDVLNLSSEETKSETDKILEDEKLQEQYLENKGRKIVIKQGFYFVVGSIAGVVIALAILKKITVKKQKKTRKK